MSDFRAQVILRTVDAIPANFITNSFAFEVNPDGPADTGDMTVAYKDFYDDLTTILSPAIAQNGHMVKFYELPGVTPNYPFAETTFNLAAAPAGTELPSEVAMVLSFQGVRQAGFPQARRRGRIFIGPLDSVTLSGGRPFSGSISQLATAGATLKSNIEAVGTGDHSWTVWSVADQSGVHVDNGWVDNSFDTQRRRGVTPTSRTTFI